LLDDDEDDEGQPPPELLLLLVAAGGVSDDDTVVDELLLANADDDAVEADDVLGIVGLLVLVGLEELSGFVEELATDGPGAVPTFGAGMFWQFGSYASARNV